MSGSRPPASKATAAKTLKAPVSTRELTTREKVLVLKSSKLNGFTFPPWDREPGMAEFLLSGDKQLFLDEPELSISHEHQAIFDSWKRPAEAFNGPHMGKIKPIDLVQDSVSDCSVVASLCAGIARAERGHAKILRNVLYPYDEAAGCPRLSPNGKYIVKLNFNGTSRKVVIDDRLPTTKSPRILHVIDRNNPGLLWPALVEKAYLKVRGGYDFPGSNSGTDLWVLSGWIPEQIFLRRYFFNPPIAFIPAELGLHRDETDRNKLWTRILRAFQWGDVMVTIGTGSITADDEKILGLAGHHDYVVLDMKEIDDRREMLIKNPWLKGTEWKGANGTPNDGSTAYEGQTQDLLSIDSDSSLSPGTFWMGLDDVMQNFESLYLNWNPGLFKYRQDIHFAWDLTLNSANGRSPVGSFATNPQHIIAAAEDGPVWLLLSRHFPDKTSTFDDEPRYISLYAFASGGKRVNLSKGAIEQGPYVDSPQVLLPLNVTGEEPYTIVTSEQDLPPSLHHFAISAFSNSPISVSIAPSRFQFQVSGLGSWTAATAGGNASSSRYCENPQYSLSIADEASSSVLLQTLDENLRVHVKIVRGGGKRVYAITSRDIIADSGDYRRGWALAEPFSPLDAGLYTIICSSFDAGQTGDFSLLVHSNAAMTLKPIPKEGAGRIRTQLATAWFGAGVKALAAPLHPQRLTLMNLTAKYVDNSAGSDRTGVQLRCPAPSPLRLTIELGRGPDRHIVIASSGGEFSDNPTGIRTEDAHLDPEVCKKRDMWLVLERMGGGYSALSSIQEKVQVEMLWEGVDKVDVGVWREWERYN